MITKKQITAWEAYIKKLQAWLKASKAAAKKKDRGPGDHPPPPPPHP